MSESVKIGAIGSNPAIDNINQMEAGQIKEYVMHKIDDLVTGNQRETRGKYRPVALDFKDVGGNHGLEE